MRRLQIPRYTFVILVLDALLVLLNVWYVVQGYALNLLVVLFILAMMAWTYRLGRSNYRTNLAIKELEAKLLHELARSGYRPPV